MNLGASIIAQTRESVGELNEIKMRWVEREKGNVAVQRVLDFSIYEE